MSSRQSCAGCEHQSTALPEVTVRSHYLHDHILATFGDDLVPGFGSSTRLEKETGPMLQRKGPNTILIFPGLFDPAHKGHLELLRHAYDSAGSDINVIAAVVAIVTDTCSFSEEALMRSLIWKLDGFVKSEDWIFIYTSPPFSWRWQALRLQASILAAGFEINFWLLVGPHCLRYLRFIAEYGHHNVLVSDVSLDAAFRPTRSWKHDSLKAVEGFSKWEPVKYNEAEVREFVRQKMPMASEQSTEFKAAVEAEEFRLIMASECAPLDPDLKDMRIRFLPCCIAFRPSNLPTSDKLAAILSLPKKTKQVSLLEAHHAMSPFALFFYSIIELFTIALPDLDFETVSYGLDKAAEHSKKRLEHVLNYIAAVLHISYDTEARTGMVSLMAWLLHSKLAGRKTDAELDKEHDVCREKKLPRINFFYTPGSAKVYLDPSVVTNVVLSNAANVDELMAAFTAKGVSSKSLTSAANLEKVLILVKQMSGFFRVKNGESLVSLWL